MHTLDFNSVVPSLCRKKETKPEPAAEKQWKRMDDISLHLLIKEAKEFVVPLQDGEQCAALAR